MPAVGTFLAVSKIVTNSWRCESVTSSFVARAAVGGQVTVAFFRRFARFYAVVMVGCLLCGRSLQAEPIGPGWPQPNGPGTPINLTYSYSNLLDGSFFLISPDELRAATEEALRLWATYAPLNFIEVPDAGPVPSDVPYPADGAPLIRIGHHVSTDLAHAFYPGSDGLAGDVHVASGVPWTLGENNWNFLEAITHELGHALGLPHELDEPAIMNPSYPFHRFAGLGSTFLFPSDIRAIQGLYGVGHGSVQPLDPAPEPTTWLLVGAGVSGLGFSRRRRSG